MNKKLGLAVAGALVAFSSAANAGITIPAGDWTVDIGGNVNAFYQHTTGGGSTNTINTGLLPAAIGFGAKTRQNDLDVAFQFTFFTGTDSTNNAVSAGAHGYGNNAALGMNSLNIRQAFMSVGDASWGSFKLGRDLGVFESDAILSDMTLLGVGSPAGGGNTTLGRIGSGYLYADWKTQLQYSTPNWNGFQVTVALDSPWQATAYGAGNALGANDNKDMGFEGKATYDFAANDATGRVWVGGISQKVNAVGVAAAGATSYAVATHATNSASFTANGFDVGGKVAYAGAELVASYYSGEGIGSLGFLLGAYDTAASTKTKSDGYYVQGTYKLPGVGTKVGLSYGESSVDKTSSTHGTTSASWIVGAYHPLTKSVNLVAEYTYGIAEEDTKADVNTKTVSLGAIMFF